jgi:SAM-dependent methyltransferase
LDPDLQTAAFFDQIAAEYDEKLTTRREDLLARRAFRDLVQRHVAPSSTIFDFGCGTGLDAQFYAAQGYRVLAYDSSAGMLARFRNRCSAEISAGRITACDELASAGEAPHAIVSNFAVLNLIRDPEPLFESFARRLAAPGWLILSVLNPIHWALISKPAWWRNAPPRPHSIKPTSYLHRIPALLRGAQQFRLIGRANSGGIARFDAPGEPTTWWGGEQEPSALRRMLWHTPAHRLLGHFVFLVLRRDP